ncbi:MAG: DUF2804 domain-containing protein [Rhodoglobus sp.]|nr:DUF2804 domain-containing protein [Rhodoglobus sp.]
MTISEHEIVAPVSLTLPSGRLNPAAVGFTRRPIHDTSGVATRTGWGRNKRWEYWAVVSPTHLLAVTVASIDFAAVSEVWVFDRSTGREVGRSAIRPFGAGVVLPPSLGDGNASARASGLSIDVIESEGGTLLLAEIEGARFEVNAALPVGHERLGVVVPWSDRRFQYTVKDVARPATGWVEVAGRRTDLDADDTWAVLDHGRGKWPYDVRWNWGAGSGRSKGRVIGVQIGAKWTDGTGSTENALVVDGRLLKISVELSWDYDPVDWMAPWQIHGESADLTFVPFHNKSSRTRLGIISTRTDQLFGHYSGWMRDDSGARIEFDGVLGWTEDVHNRW